jgi:hypothetical protein
MPYKIPTKKGKNGNKNIFTAKLSPSRNFAVILEEPCLKNNKNKFKLTVHNLKANGI